jgi:hypothetical protein
MALKSIIINGSKYNYWEPDSYTDMKLYIKQCKRIREKIRACNNGCIRKQIYKGWQTSLRRLS